MTPEHTNGFYNLEMARLRYEIARAYATKAAIKQSNQNFQDALINKSISVHQEILALESDYIDIQTLLSTSPETNIIKSAMNIAYRRHDHKIAKYISKLCDRTR